MPHPPPRPGWESQTALMPTTRSRELWEWKAQGTDPLTRAIWDTRYLPPGAGATLRACAPFDGSSEPHLSGWGQPC